MAEYSIKDLEFLSGIKAHTLRIWEQRYKLLTPNRSDTNIRSYSEEDMKFLLNVSLLYNNGYKISKIAKMKPEEIGQEVINITETNFEYNSQIKALTISMIELDENRFEKILSTNILQSGFEKTMLKLIYPFLKRIGILWQTGAVNPAQEHFISNLIRQKIIVAIDGQIVPSNDNAKQYLLYLPEGELHELSLLFANFVIKSRHNRVTYLGASVPLEDVKSVYDYHKPDYIFSIITSSKEQEDIQHYINQMSESFKDSTVLVTGLQVEEADIEIPSNVIHITSFEQMIDFAEKNAVTEKNYS